MDYFIYSEQNGLKYKNQAIRRLSKQASKQASKTFKNMINVYDLGHKYSTTF